MARLDVYPMPGGRPGYVVDVQANLLNGLQTRIAVPLIPEHEASKPISDLNPIFQINGQPYVLLTQALASVPSAELKQAILSLDPHHDAVVRALDLLLVGF